MNLVLVKDEGTRKWLAYHQSDALLKELLQEAVEDFEYSTCLDTLEGLPPVPTSGFFEALSNLNRANEECPRLYFINAELSDGKFVLYEGNKVPLRSTYYRTDFCLLRRPNE